MMIKNKADALVVIGEQDQRIAQLEKALKYCYDDKEVMQNEIAVLKEELSVASPESDKKQN